MVHIDTGPRTIVVPCSLRSAAADVFLGLAVIEELTPTRSKLVAGKDAASIS